MDNGNKKIKVSPYVQMKTAWYIEDKAKLEGITLGAVVDKIIQSQEDFKKVIGLEDDDG
jgi:hypothetical protein